MDTKRLASQLSMKATLTTLLIRDGEWIIENHSNFSLKYYSLGTLYFWYANASSSTNKGIELRHSFALLSALLALNILRLAEGWEGVGISSYVEQLMLMH